MNSLTDATDVLVIGAGPAGLTAATYLARFRRSVIVADGGDPRASWIPVSHNTPGFPAGVAGAAILSRLRDQAEEYGAVIETGRIETLGRDAAGFVLTINDRRLAARAVVLATGVRDLHPRIDGVEQAIRASLIRICPICDGFEAMGERIAVIGDGDNAAREAAFLKTYSGQVTLIHVGDRPIRQAAALRSLGIGLVETSVDRIRLSDRTVVVLGPDGVDLEFDTAYSAFGTSPNAALAATVGAAVDADGRLVVDLHQQTSVDGLYAAGDVVRGLNQIAVATAEGAVAATAIHNALRKADGETL